MSLLAGVNYDPATMVTKSCGTALALTALDTTNLRLTFNAPTSGKVLVRLRTSLYVSSYPMAGVMLGVLEGATIRVRAYPDGVRFLYGSGANWNPAELIATITGLTAGGSYTWDAAYGVDVVSAYTTLRYGGPDDATTANSAGAFQFEVWTA